MEGNPRLRQILEPAVMMSGCELVAIEYVPRGAGQTLRLYIDREGGITVDDCERVSRQVSSVLDVEDPISGHYTLEVSSPGLDRPLTAARDFERFSGREVKLRTDAPVDGQRNFRGLLHGLHGGEVLLEVDGREIRLPLNRIEKARLVPEL